MARIDINVKTNREVPGTLNVDEDQDMKVPPNVDSSETKRAGDLVSGDQVYHGPILFTVV